MISIIISIIILVLGSILSIWVARQRDSKAFAILYLWLVKLGEAKAQSIESHPTYLKNICKGEKGYDSTSTRYE